MSNLPAPISKPAAKNTWNDDNDGWGDDDWNFDNVKNDKKDKLDNVDYNNYNLNKLSNDELKKHK